MAKCNRREFQGSWTLDSRKCSGSYRKSNWKYWMVLFCYLGLAFLFEASTGKSAISLVAAFANETSAAVFSLWAGATMGMDTAYGLRCLSAEGTPFEVT
jgi:hypothetical protein